jgi:hypothetical protein
MDCDLCIEEKLKANFLKKKVIHHDGHWYIADALPIHMLRKEIKMRKGLMRIYPIERKISSVKNGLDRLLSKIKHDHSGPNHLVFNPEKETCPRCIALWLMNNLQEARQMAKEKRFIAAKAGRKRGSRDL